MPLSPRTWPCRLCAAGWPCILGGRTTFLFVAANWKEPQTSRPQFVQRCGTSIATGDASCGNACRTTRRGSFASSCSVRQFGDFPLMALALRFGALSTGPGYGSSKGKDIDPYKVAN